MGDRGGRWRFWGRSVAGVLAIGYLFLCLGLRLVQTRLMFFPESELKATPATIGLNYEPVWIAMSIGKLYGWWIPAAADAPVLLYLHGNGSNLGDLVHRADRWHQLGLAVLLIDYRGYGDSQGPFPNETRVYEDAEAAWQYLTVKRQIASSQIVIYGESIGGAVAIDLAVRHPDAAGVIVESSFTSMRAMVQRTLPLLPVDWLLTQKFDSLHKVGQLQVPILLIHGTADQTVPAEMSQALFAAAAEPKRLFLVPNADHDTVVQIGGAAYWDQVRQFMQDCRLLRAKS